MPFPRLLAVFFTLATFQVFAVTPQDMEMDEAGSIKIHTDKLGDMTLLFGLTETSEGVWKGPPEVPRFPSLVGAEIEREGVYGFPDGSKVDHKLTAKIAGGDLKVNVDWPTTSTAKGFGMAVLKIPQEEAQDLTVLANESEIVKNYANIANIPQHVDEMVFRRTSTGEFLFKVSGEDLSFSIVADPEHPEIGMDLRMSEGNSLETMISEFTKISCTISFKE